MVKVTCLFNILISLHERTVGVQYVPRVWLDAVITNFAGADVNNVSFTISVN
jgi:hypothetical protein